MNLRAVIWCSVSTKAQAEDDKDSLPTQEAAGRELCRKNNWTIIEVLRVPGHSRRYIDIHKCAKDMRNKGIDAFDRLLELWDKSAFDILVVRDGNRFARTQSLHAYVIESTILGIGARIYSFADGWVDENNYRMFISMSGYKSASEVDALVKFRHNYMDKAGKQGLPTSSHLVMSHTPVYGKGLKLEKIIVDESKRRLWDNLYALIIEGVSWDKIEDELYKRYGHINPNTGKQYGAGTLYKVIYNPYFWGNSGRHYNDPSAHRPKVGSWIYDENAPCPEGVELYYNTHQAVWVGEQADRIKAELRRRQDLIKGRNRPYRSEKFSGLLLCNTCKSSFVSRRDSRERLDGSHYKAWGCQTPYTVGPKRCECDQRKTISDKKVIDAVNKILVFAVMKRSLAVLASDHTPDNLHRIDEIRQAITGVESGIEELINAQIGADEAIRHLYQNRIDTATFELKGLHRNLKELLKTTESPQVEAQRQKVFDNLVDAGVDALWNKPSVEINQTLHILFGDIRLVVHNGEVTGRVRKPARR